MSAHWTGSKVSKLPESAVCLFVWSTGNEENRVLVCTTVWPWTEDLPLPIPILMQIIFNLWPNSMDRQKSYLIGNALKITCSLSSQFLEAWGRSITAIQGQLGLLLLLTQTRLERGTIKRRTSSRSWHLGHFSWFKIHVGGPSSLWAMLFWAGRQALSIKQVCQPASQSVFLPWSSTLASLSKRL